MPPGRSRAPECCTLWSLDARLTEQSPADLPDTPLDRLELLGPVAVTHLVRALTEVGGRSPRLVLATRGAQVVAADAGAPDPAQGGLWGLARVVALEHAELRPTIVDLDPADGRHGVPGLVDELLHRPGGEQVALRGGRRYVPRLVPWRAPAATPARPHPFDRSAADGNYRLLSVQEHLGSLTPVLSRTRAARPRPGADRGGRRRTQLQRRAQGDGDLPRRTPGHRAAGRRVRRPVTALGAGVTGLSVGDAVMAVAPSSMAAYTTTRAELVAPVPGGLTDEQAAALPIAFLTVVYGLEYLAHLGEGDTLLIHSATGGVGLAALQLARRDGAEVLATAGSEEKRELLRRLGVKHVMDSRSLRFADEVLALTDGRGVDVVLNSLTGEALTRSLGLLAPNGRFVEIGKQDIYADSHLGLRALRHNRRSSPSTWNAPSPSGRS